MIHDVQEFFGLERAFKDAGYFKTEAYSQTFNDLKHAISSSRLVALTGIVGCGKTTAARKMREELEKKDAYIVAVSHAIDKDRVTVNTLLTALFLDLSADKNIKISNQAETRERQLIELIRKRKKNVVMFIDEAHDLSHKTLKCLKRLTEVFFETPYKLSIVLIGQPKLRIDLERPSLEEIGARSIVLKLEGIRGYEKEYINWLLTACLRKDVSRDKVFSPEAIDVMANRLSTPLQINNYAMNALERAHQIGCKTVTGELMEMVISPDFEGIEARAQRCGYNPKSLCEALDVKPGELKALFNSRLQPPRMQELHQELLRLGLAQGGKL